MLKRSLGGAPFQLRHYGLTQFNLVGSSGPIVILDMSQVGTLTRASSGSYLAGATSSLAWALPNVRRFEDRGDGSGPQLLLEGTRINYVRANRNVTDATSWAATTFGNITRSLDPGPGIDGHTSITRLRLPTDGAGGAWGYPQTIAGPVASGTFSAFVKAFALPSDEWQVNVGATLINLGSSGSFSRKSRGVSTCALTVYPADHSSGITAATDLLVDLFQIEAGAFPSSPIWTLSSASGTRGADVLSIPPASIPHAIGSGSFYFDIWPAFSSNEAVSSSVAVTSNQSRFDLLSFGPSSYLVLSGTGFRLSASTGMQTELSTSALVWNSHQKLRVIVAADQGYLEISGATSGNGRYWTSNASAFKFFTASSLVIGSTSGTNASPYFGRISNFILTGSNPILLDLMSEGNFLRNSSGTYLISAPTDGGSAFMMHAPHNVRRLEDRGDTEGPKLLLEGQRSNFARNTRNPMDFGVWLSSAGTTASFASGPDGFMSATRMNIDSGQFGNYQSPPNMTGAFNCSQWQKTGPGPTSGSGYQMRMNTPGFATIQCVSGLFSGNLWRRNDLTMPHLSLGLSSFTSVEGRSFSVSQGGQGAALARDVIADFYQVEKGEFPTSAIWSTSSVLPFATRMTDILSFSPNQIPIHITSGVFSFDIWPDFSSNEATSSLDVARSGSLLSGTFNLLSYGPSDYLAFSGSKLVLTASIGFGAPEIVTDALSWARYQKITITIDSRSGTLEVSGAAGSGRFYNSASLGWQFSTGSSLVIGSASGTNASPFFGRISNFRQTGSNPALIDLAFMGIFTRTSSGSMYNGSTSSISFLGTNQRRFENKGDGPVYKTEGSRTNLIESGRDQGAGTWAAGASVVTTLDYASGVDGDVAADRSVIGANGYSKYRGPLTVGSGSVMAMSFFAKRPSGSADDFVQYGIQDNALNGVGFRSATVSQDFARYTVTRKINGGGHATYYVHGDGRTAGDITAKALDYISDFHQLESGSFVSSPIWTSGATATRGQDILRIPTGSFPTSLLSGGAYEFDIYPEFLPMHMHSASSGQFLFDLNAGQGGCQVSYGAAGDPAKIFIYSSGGVGYTGAAAFGWTTIGQKMTITIKPSEGWVEVSGATTGGGLALITPWQWPTDPAQIAYLQIGARGTNSLPFYGRISNFYVSGSRSPISLDLFDASIGTFTRSTSGSYYSGSTSVIAWKSPNERRIEVTGSDNIQWLKMEGARTNLIRVNHPASGAGIIFTNMSGMFDETGVDGLANAAVRMSGTTTNNSFVYGGATIVAASRYCFSVFARGTSGSQAHVLRATAGSTITSSVRTIAQATYSRSELFYSGTAGATSSNNFIVTSVDTAGEGGAAAGSKDIIIDLPQVELGSFPSSPIWCSGAAGGTSRAQDSLTYTMAQLPPTFFTKGFTFTFAPDYSSAELLAGGAAIGLISRAGLGSYVQFSFVATAALYVTTAAGLVSTSAMTWSRGQMMRFTINYEASTVTVVGATTGNGTYSIAPLLPSAAGLSFGPAFGRFGRYIESL